MLVGIGLLFCGLFGGFGRVGVAALEVIDGIDQFIALFQLLDNRLCGIGCQIQPQLADLVLAFDLLLHRPPGSLRLLVGIQNALQPFHFLSERGIKFRDRLGQFIDFAGGCFGRSTEPGLCARQCINGFLAFVNRDR